MDYVIKKVKDLKKGDFFTLREPDKYKDLSAAVYQRGDFYRPDKVYECPKFDDISRAAYLRGDKFVFTAFTF